MSSGAAWLICQINSIASFICKQAALDEIDLETLVDLSVARRNVSFRVNGQLENSYLSSANGRAKEKERGLRENGYVPPEGGAA